MSFFALLGALVVVAGQTEVTLSWEPATGPVAGYEVFVGNQSVGTTTATQHTIACAGWPEPQAAVVVAFDGLGNQGPLSEPSVLFTCPALSTSWDPDADGDGDVDSQDFRAFMDAFGAGELWP